MDFTYFMLQIPPSLLLVIILLLFAAIGSIGTYCFRKYVVFRPLRSHNEVVGYIFATLGGFYGLLLGFVVFFVWDSLNGAQKDASQEASSAKALYRDIRYYPQPAKVAKLKTVYLLYVHSVVEQEFPDMETMKPLDKHNRDSFNKVFETMGQLDMRDAYSAQMFRQLNELATYRSLRQLDSSSSIPFEIWVPLLAGGAIILVFAMLLDVESWRLHVFVNGLLGTFIGLVIYIIIILDHPFTGKMKIEPDAYKSILLMDKEDI
ncbi:DUF4239 domain-containing protein [Pedobacter sp. L105]|uniref:bestrophin-like domain n=1 Tax=Pedobacter sp. L105 TaxID=1641871 RepID=UPI00131B8AAA|nr:DUF4239 domain-containing protein [Pedobacter sp. L105]